MRHQFLFILFFLLFFICLSANVNDISYSEDPTDCELQVFVPADFHICFDEEFSLDGIIDGDYDEYVWFENSNETNYDLDEEISIDETTTFTLVAKKLSEENIIINGDFASGNSDFTTDYTIGNMSCYGLGLLDCEGTYDILDDPNIGHANFSSCSDHSGDGNMMVVNGAPDYQQVWCQEVCVEEGSTYLFSAWAASVNPASPAELQFSIDGNLIGQLFGLSGNLCDWEEFQAEWISTATTVIEICVTNQNTNPSGNDFALDDISFFKYCEDQASFTVTHSEFELQLLGTEDLNCIRSSTDGLITVEPLDDYDFTFLYEDDILDEDSGSDYYFELNTPGIYTVNVTDQYGCMQELEFEISADYEIPDLELYTTDTINCTQDYALLISESNTRSVIISWYDSDNNFLDSADELEVNSAGLYYAEAMDPDNGCTFLDSIVVTEDMGEESISLISDGNLSCNNPNVLLSITPAVNTVNWYFEQQLIAEDIDSLTIAQAGWYFVESTADNGCQSQDSILIIDIQPNFDYAINYDTLINCLMPSSAIELIIDTNALNVSWIDISNLSSSTHFTLDGGGTYSFILQDSLGCQWQDSIIIAEDFSLPQFEIHTDSLDCSGAAAVSRIINASDSYLTYWYVEGDTIQADSIILSEPIIINYSVFADNGCMVEGITEIVSSEEYPNFSIIGDTINCLKPSITLYAFSNQANLDYFWTTPDSVVFNSDTLISDSGGTFALEAKNELNCTSKKFFTVVIDTLSPIITLPDDLMLDCNMPSFVSELPFELGNMQIEFDGNWIDINSKEIFVNEAGNYKIQATSSNGCTKVDSFMVALDTLSPEFSIGDKFELNCNSPDLSIFPEIAHANSSYYWVIDNNTILTDTLYIDKENEINLIVTGPNGCISDTIISVTTDFQNPMISLSTDTINCINTTAHIELICDLPISQATMNGIEIDTALIQWIEVDNPDVYSFLVEAKNGCTESQSIEVLSDTNTIAFKVFSDTIRCNNPFADIEIESDENINQYSIYTLAGEWIGTNLPSLDSDGLYYAEIINDNGCISTYDFEVEELIELPQIEYIGTSPLICQSALWLDELIITGATPPYIINIDNIDYTYPLSDISLEGAGIHNINVTDFYSCEADTSVFVDKVDSLNLAGETEITLQFLSPYSFILSINKTEEEIEHIEWQPQLGLSCYDCLMPEFLGSESTVYKVIVKDIYGCEDELEFRVLVEQDIKYYIPNVIITDNINNHQFTVFSKGNDIAKIESMLIYDRWGNQMFERHNFDSNNPELGWDGYRNNQKVVPGVYAYLIKLLLRNGETEIVAGDVTVLR